VLPTSQGSVIDGNRDAMQSSAVVTPVPSSANANNWEEVKPAGKNQAQPKATVHAQVPVAQNPVPTQKTPQNSPLGIGVGAVVGGVLGNQVGSGDGKTLATILGAVGGGYIGNEIAKKNQ
jgi:uncharacterized protein YcfJ